MKEIVRVWVGQANFAMVTTHTHQRKDRPPAPPPSPRHHHQMLAVAWVEHLPLLWFIKKGERHFQVANGSCSPPFNLPSHSYAPQLWTGVIGRALQIDSSPQSRPRCFQWKFTGRRWYERSLPETLRFNFAAKELSRGLKKPFRNISKILYIQSWSFEFFLLLPKGNLQEFPLDPIFILTFAQSRWCGWFNPSPLLDRLYLPIHHQYKWVSITPSALLERGLYV